MAKIYFIDVTNRDGVQTAKLGLSKLEKTQINRYLNEMGVFQSEFGFPCTRHESRYLRANLELARMDYLSPLRLGGWIRAIVHDVKTAFRMVPGIEHLNLSISTLKGVSKPTGICLLITIRTLGPRMFSLMNPRSEMGSLR